VLGFLVVVLGIVIVVLGIVIVLLGRNHIYLKCLGIVILINNNN
jgi:hypothetical protein